MNIEAFLAAQQNTENSVQSLKTSLESQEKNSYDFLGDKRWKPSFPKDSGAVEYLIRFLPFPDTDKPQFLRTYSHSFTDKATSTKVYETCPTTVGENCPICENNKQNWDSSPEKYRPRTRKERHYSNILVIKDPLNPENDNGVFVYEMPKTIMGLIKEAIEPKLPSETPFDPCNIFSGSVLHIKAILGSNGYWNYDKSIWLEPKPLTDYISVDLKTILSQIYDLSTIPDKLGIKSYEQLSTIVDKLEGRHVQSQSKLPFESSTSTPTPVTTTPTPISQTPQNTQGDDSGLESILSDVDSIIGEL